MPSVFLQIKALLQKNALCSYREKEFIADLILPIVTAILVSLKSQLQFLGFFAPLFLSVAISTPPRSLLINLVQEKSERQKESQKIMGMKQRSYTIGWIVFGYLKTFMATAFLLLFWLICNQLINDGDYGFTEQTSTSKVFWTYLIYSTSIFNFSLALSTIFSSPKLASEVSTFVTILTILLTFLVFLEDVRGSVLFYRLMSLFPQSCISFVYMGILSGKRNFYDSETISKTFSIDDAALQMGIESIAYFILYFYLDQVFPNQYGVAKSPFFFITALFKNNKKEQQNSLLHNNQDHEEDFSSAIYHQQIQNNKESTVIIQGLTKKFGNFTAVDKLSIKLYQSEILCLLGHNGAGKTTTISMLTGMIDKTEGKVYINGEDLEQNLDAIRENVGICTQRDVLYDSLTVIEQLQFMGRIKGLEGIDLSREIQDILETTQLKDEKDKLIKVLSGGSRRKLSLALALVGGSSVIFLDEPTSGMDAMSRRGIWEILENVKSQNRTIVLTTHHLDEAEVLADRIAIMAAGKLLACGKCDYIKMNFGEGYHLSISSQQESIREKIKQILNQYIPEAQLDPQSQSDTLLYLVLFKSKPKLEVVMKALDQLSSDIIINLKLNSLEDAFINIGMDENKFIEKAHQKMSVNNENEVYSGNDRIEENDQFENQQMKNIPIPDCLNRAPQFIFLQQFYAIFLRKQYTTVRTFSNYIAIIIPFALIVVGTLIIDELNFSFLKSEEQIEYFKLVLISLFVILAFCFNSSLFITLPVLEREFNLKYALNVMGCRTMPYWLGTFAYDFILYSFFVITFVIFSYIMSLSFVTQHIGMVVSAFVTFGFAYISFSYFAGIALYTQTSKAMKSFPFVNFFIIYCMPQNIWGIAALFWQKELLNKDVMEVVIMVIEGIFSFLSPFFSFQRAFQNIIKMNTQGFDNSPPVLTNSSVYYTITMLYQGIFYFVLTLALEARNNNKLIKSNQRNQIEDFKKSNRVAPQVLQEEERLLLSKDPIKMIHVRKTYENGLEALQDISFGVEPKNILGLLGPNGAGKSTTFNILTSLISKSGGNVKIKGKEVKRGDNAMFMDVGICPQFDCLWENLTPKEHLQLFGRMKGLSGQDLNESVEYFLQTMQLEEYVNRQAGRLSGGNKRKLCVSDALIGGPAIQFFDEPSTGVDPIARRFLWRTLKLGVKLRESSVVLTTHTMDEAESLCDKIAFLINGQIYCIGSPQELRSQFGEGYTLILRQGKNQQKQIMQLLTKRYGSVALLQEDEENLHLHISSKDFRFYEIYCILQEMVKNEQITDFQFTQSSLESVFLQFSKKQDVPN